MSPPPPPPPDCSHNYVWLKNTTETLRPEDWNGDLGTRPMKMSRVMAKTACANLGAQLPMPKTEADNAALFAYASQNEMYTKLKDLGKVSGLAGGINTNWNVFLGTQGGWPFEGSEWTFPDDTTSWDSRNVYEGGLWLWNDGTSFEAPRGGKEDDWRLNATPKASKYRFWEAFPESCSKFDWEESVVEACRRYGNSCHDLPEHLQDTCLHSAHPQANYSNWKKGHPNKNPESSWAAMSLSNGQWITGKSGENKESSAYAVCQGVCSPPPLSPPPPSSPPPAPPPPSSPPPAPPPCDTLVLTLYNPCKCGWADFNVSMGDATVAFGAQAARASVLTTMTLCLFPSCQQFSIGPGAPNDLEWYLTDRNTEDPLVDDRGGVDRLYCHKVPHPPPSQPPVPLAPAPPGGFSPPPPDPPRAPPPPPSVPPQPPRAPYDPRPPDNILFAHQSPSPPPLPPPSPPPSPPPVPPPPSPPPSPPPPSPAAPCPPSFPPPSPPSPPYIPALDPSTPPPLPPPRPPALPGCKSAEPSVPGDFVGADFQPPQVGLNPNPEPNPNPNFHPNPQPNPHPHPNHRSAMSMSTARGTASCCPMGRRFATLPP